MVSNKLANSNVTLRAFHRYPSHHPFHTKFHSCCPDKDLARSSHYTLLQDIVHIVGTRVPSVTAISVLYVIYWRIKRYAHTVFIVLEAVPDPKVLSPELWPSLSTTNKWHSLYVLLYWWIWSTVRLFPGNVGWSLVHRLVPQACRFGFGFSDVQTSTGSTFLSQ
jgi:hypothetical protein